MDEKKELWVQEIRRRTKIKRQRYRRRLCSCLTALNLCLLIGIRMLLQDVAVFGVAEVEEGFGSVLLRGEVSVYVVIGIAAFAGGVIFTIICIRYQRRKKKNDPDDS